MAILNSHTTVPWYREPWPWLLMLGPAIVIVAGSYTLWLAVSTADGLVADDYYKQGLAINRRLARGDTAAKLGMLGHARFELDTVVVGLRSDSAQLPPTLTLTLVHPTRAGLDQSVVLERGANGEYAAKISAPAPGRWIITIEQRDWRLAGHWQAPFNEAIELRPGG